MSWIKWALAPWGNRNYVTTKQYNRLVIARYIPGLLALIVGWVAIPELRWLWVAIGAGMIALGLLGYFFIDKWAENLEWKHFWSKHYKKNSEHKEEK
jgi:hypothetical protein